MSAHHRPLLFITGLALAASLLTAQAYANQLVYVPLTQPCRLLDTRPSTGSATPLTAAHGAYLFGTSATDIAAQHGNFLGCGIPSGIEAVSVNMNMLDATASGNIATWSAYAGPTAPNIGTAVYNPTVTSPMAGQVQYNTGYTTVPVAPSYSSNGGRFYLQVANGQIDMTINVVGYWRPISWSENSNGETAVALGVNTAATGHDSTALGVGTTAVQFASTAMGYNTEAGGEQSTAMGHGSIANGDTSTAMGNDTRASGASSTAMGNQTQANGSVSTAMGEVTSASGYASTAMGRNTEASGDYSTAMGRNVSTNIQSGSFIYGDASTRSQVTNTAPNQFVVAATGGVYFFTGCGTMCTTGVGLASGSGSWFSLSDRNAKTAVQPVDGREVLKKVAALPLNTWQYKTQESKYRHMGPMAQDFYAAFQLGETDKGIDTVDADGVALAAIQGLNAVLADKEREIGNLRAELVTQKTRVASLESLTAELAEVKAEVAALRSFAPKKTTVALRQP